MSRAIVFMLVLLWSIGVEASQTLYRAEDLLYRLSNPWESPRSLGVTTQEGLVSVSPNPGQFIEFDIVVNEAGDYALEFSAQVGEELGKWGVLVNNGEVTAFDFNSQSQHNQRFDLGIHNLQKGVAKIKFISMNSGGLCLDSFYTDFIEQQSNINFKGDLNSRNYEVTADVLKMPTESASILVRAKPSEIYQNSYYAATLTNTAEIVLEKVSFGIKETLATAQAEETPREIAVSVQGQRIDVKVNGKQLITHFDVQLQKGCIGTLMTEEVFRNIAYQKITTGMEISSGKLVTIEGNITQEGGKEISIVIKDEQGKTLYMDQGTANQDGRFLFKIKLPPKGEKSIYKVDVCQQGGQSIQDAFLYHN